MPNKTRRKYNIPVSGSTKAENAKYVIKSKGVPFYNLHPYFSFRYYDKDNHDFTVEKFQGIKDFKKFFTRLYEISQETWKDILITKKEFYHAHEVDWEDTSCKNGFHHLPKNLCELAAYQFEIFEECRIFGFFNHNNVFKVVWIDRDHIVYPRK